MEDKETELLSKVSANHIFLAQFEPFRATLRSLRSRNPDVALAILQTIVAKGGRFDSVLYSHSCPSPALLSFLCTLELLEFKDPTSNLWSFGAEALKLRAEFLLYLQVVTSRVLGSRKKRENSEAGDGNGMNVENLDLDNCLTVLERISGMGLSRLRPDLIEDTSRSDTVLDEEEIMSLGRVFLENADVVQALCMNIQKQVSGIDDENSAMHISLRSEHKSEEAEDKVLKLIQRSVQTSHLDAMKECLAKDDVDGAISHIKFLNLDYGVEEKEHRYFKERSKISYWLLHACWWKSIIKEKKRKKQSGVSFSSAVLKYTQL